MFNCIISPLYGAVKKYFIKNALICLVTRFANRVETDGFIHNSQQLCTISTKLLRQKRIIRIIRRKTCRSVIVTVKNKSAQNNMPNSRSNLLSKGGGPSLATVEDSCLSQKNGDHSSPPDTRNQQFALPNNPHLH